MQFMMRTYCPEVSVVAERIKMRGLGMFLASMDCAWRLMSARLSIDFETNSQATHELMPLTRH
jgi:hypothetical protein